MTSPIDALDDSGRPIGVVARGRVFQAKANFRTVHVFVFNHEDNVLLQQLAETRERNPGKLGSSVAAYPHAGEPPIEAASRRLYEELGLRTPVIDLGTTVMTDNGVKKFISVFKTVGDEPRIAEPEHIAELTFLPPGLVDALVENRPDSFTETFLHVWRFYRELESAAQATR